MGAENAGTVGQAGRSDNGQQPAAKQPAAGDSTSRTESPGTRSDHRTGTTAETETGKSGEKIPVVANVDLERAEARAAQKRESARRAQARKEAIAKGEPIPEWAQKRTPGTRG